MAGLDGKQASGCCGLFRWRQKHGQHTERIVAHPVIGEEQRKYCGNKTTTTKYNLLTFIPKSLFEQYRWDLGNLDTLVALVEYELVLCGVTCTT